MRVTAVRTILVTAPWTGDPFWLPGERFERTAALVVVETDDGIRGVGETIKGYFCAKAVSLGITLPDDFAERYPFRPGVVEYA